MPPVPPVVAPVAPPPHVTMSVRFEWMERTGSQGQTKDVSAVVDLPKARLGRVLPYQGRLYEYVGDDAGTRVYRCHDRP